MISFKTLEAVHTHTSSFIKEEKGVTLVALAIMIVVITIIASVATYTGISTYHDMKVSAFQKKLSVIEEKVQTLKARAEEDKHYAQDLDNLTSCTSEEITKLGINSSTVPNAFNYQGNYKKITNNLLQTKLGVHNIEGDYIVNFKTGEVYSTQGIEYENRTVYSNQQIDGKTDESWRSNDSNYVTDGLILRYDGIRNTEDGHDNDAKIWKDLSGNGNDGELLDFNYDQTSGWQDKYLSFDGTDDWVRVNNILENLDDLTIEYVYKQKRAISWQYRWGIRLNRFGMESNSGNSNIFYYSNPPRLGFNFDECTFDLNQKGENTFVFENGNLKGYKNGEKKQTISMQNISLNGSYFGIGADGNGSYPTLMDCYSFRIYNRALTDDEVKNNYLVDKARFGIE